LLRVARPENVITAFPAAEIFLATEWYRLHREKILCEITPRVFANNLPLAQ